MQNIGNPYGLGVAAMASRRGDIAKEGDDMQQQVSTGGQIEVNQDGQRWKEWRGRQAYKYRFSGNAVKRSNG